MTATTPRRTPSRLRPLLGAVALLAGLVVGYLVLSGPALYFFVHRLPAKVYSPDGQFIMDTDDYDDSHPVLVLFSPALMVQSLNWYHMLFFDRIPLDRAATPIRLKGIPVAPVVSTSSSP